jgi:glycosyltransferase involved in cell wall biosynthesis
VSAAAAVAIVLPVRNGAAYLRESLDSCLAQTWTRWALIVVDDGSTDATGEIVAEYARRDPRVTVVTHATSQGLPRSLNAGFARATAPYLTWTSDDNRYRPHALARLVQVLERHADVDLVYSDYAVIDEDGREIEQRRALPIERLATVNCVGASFLYRRIVHESLGGFDAARPLVEDYDFWLRAASRFRLMPLSEDLYQYRVHRSSLSTRHDRAIVDTHRALLRSHLPSMRWLDAPARARACVHMARATSKRGRPLDALSDLWLACRLDPAAAAVDCLGRAWRALRRREISDFRLQISDSPKSEINLKSEI